MCLAQQRKSLNKPSLTSPYSHLSLLIAHGEIICHFSYRVLLFHIIHEHH